MKVYTFFICFYGINVGARNYVLRVPKGMSKYFMDPENVAALVDNLKRNSVSSTSVEPQSRNLMFNKYLEPVKYMKKPFPNQDTVRQLPNQDTNQFQRPLTKKINIIRIDKPSVQDENLFPNTQINSIDSNLDYPDFRRQANEEENDDEGPDDGSDKNPPKNKHLQAEDMKKGFEKLENCFSGTGSNPGSGPVTGSASTPIKKILELLQRGVRLETDVKGPPKDSNYNWVQVKIPKNNNMAQSLLTQNLLRHFLI